MKSGKFWAWIAAAGELKTKPTQHTAQKLREIGIQADALLCRADRPIPEDERAKISLFSNVPEWGVISMWDVDTIYKVPRMLHEQGLDEMICMKLQLLTRPADLKRWDRLVHEVEHPLQQVSIAMCGKYTDLSDSYKSLNEALTHGGLANRVKVNIKWIDAELFEQSEDEIATALEPMNAILVPGGFGERGSEGKIAAVKFARERHVPFFGICLGMQMACIEGARNTAGVVGASSTEFGPTTEPVVGIITEWMTDEGIQKRETGGDLGGTMRLGAYDAKLAGNSHVAGIYGTQDISERHRHRYEVNVHYKSALEQGGLVFSGMSPDGELPEIVERPDHPWFIGVQFHPELKSRPFAPHPLFASFVAAAVKQSRLV